MTSDGVTIPETDATALIQLGTLSQPTHDLFGNIHTVENYQLNYGAYGSVFTDAPTPWQYQGKRAIGHLIYFGKRFYCPDEGRFLTPDPLGYVDAPNLYHYLLSSPLAHHDPWGLTAISLSPDTYRALVALGWAARAIAPFTGPVGVGIAVGTAAIYTGYQLYSHYKDNHPPAPPIEVLPKESSKITQKPNLPQNNNRPPKPVAELTALTQDRGSKPKQKINEFNNNITRNPEETEKKQKSSCTSIYKIKAEALDWLRENARFIKNEAGDSIFLSEDGTRCLRFDFNRTNPHNNPHAHVEAKSGKKWIKSGPIYPLDVPQN